MQWRDTTGAPSDSAGTAAPPPSSAVRLLRVGEALLRQAKYREAAAAFEQAEADGGSGESGHFVNLAFCYLCLREPHNALRTCERAIRRMPQNSDLYRLHGDASRLLGRETEARAAFMRALVLSDYAFTAAESLLLPLVAEPDGAGLLAVCEAMPPAYANCTVVRGFRAIALSRLGRTDDANALVDLDRYVMQTTFTPPEEFGGIERFNALLADEIIRNPGLRYIDAYGFQRTEQMNVAGARAFPMLAKFLQAAIADFTAEFAQRGLDRVMPPVPEEGFLRSAGNIVRDQQRHSSHLHKFAYISGMYRVAVPPTGDRADERVGAPCYRIMRGFHRWLFGLLGTPVHQARTRRRDVVSVAFLPFGSPDEEPAAAYCDTVRSRPYRSPTRRLSLVAAMARRGDALRRISIDLQQQ
jgi:tetratricopeptide (TPR) repeat protein